MNKESVKSGASGIIFWRVGNILHRDGGPAVIYPSGEEHWYQNGKIHREDGPAITDTHGKKRWWLFGIEYNPIEWMIKLLELEAQCND